MGIRLPVLLGCAACLLTACAKENPRAPIIPVYDLKFDARSSGTALVGEGDTLGGIANRYALTLEDIIRSNILGGDVIRPGQRLVLPPPRTYTVQAGDSFDRIARMFDTDMASLAAANNMAPPYTLQFGQVLTIPQTERIEPRAEPVAPRTTYSSIDAEPLTAEKPIKSDASIMAEPLRPEPVRPASAGKFARPVEGNVVSSYGPKAGGMYNDGINIAAKAGTPVSAAEGGTVAFAGEGPAGYGNLVLLKHEDGYFTVYSHLSQINVREGASVPRGAMVGRVGATGKVKEPQLHFEIRKGTESVNPENYL